MYIYSFTVRSPTLPVPSVLGKLATFLAIQCSKNICQSWLQKGLKIELKDIFFQTKRRKKEMWNSSAQSDLGWWEEWMDRRIVLYIVCTYCTDCMYIIIYYYIIYKFKLKCTTRIFCQVQRTYFTQARVVSLNQWVPFSSLNYHTKLLKGTVSPDYKCLEVISIKRPLLGHVTPDI